MPHNNWNSEVGDRWRREAATPQGHHHKGLARKTHGPTKWTPPLLALQRGAVHHRWNHFQRSMPRHPIYNASTDSRPATRRPPRYWCHSLTCPRHCVLAWDVWEHQGPHQDLWNLPNVCHCTAATSPAVPRTNQTAVAARWYWSVQHQGKTRPGHRRLYVQLCRSGQTILDDHQSYPWKTPGTFCPLWRPRCGRYRQWPSVLQPGICWLCTNLALHAQNIIATPPCK